MTLRIGMILDNDFPPDSRVESEAVSLLNAGFEVYLFSLTYKNRVSQEEINGINVVRYKSNLLTYKLSALAYTVPIYHWIVRKKIIHFIKKYNIQVIHVHDMLIARAVWWANDNNLPMILDLHENRPEIMRLYRHVNTLIGKILIHPDKWEKFQTKYIRSANQVIVVTDQARNDIIEKGHKKSEEIVVVPNTIHPDIFLNYEIDKGIIERLKGNFNILYLGDTGLRRGTDTAIESIDLIKSKIPNLRLILVGQNREDKILKEKVKKLGLEKIVVFEGWQDVSLFPSYILASDICISPLKRNAHHDSTFANKIFQYMAMGKPLVVSDCPPQANVVNSEKAGLIHIAGNPVDLADKILQLYNNPEQKNQLGENAREAVMKRWNWNNTGKELIQLYRSLALNLQ